MPKPNLSEQLDRAIQGMLAPSATGRSRRDGAAPKAPVAALARIAGELRGLPREDFKTSLRAQLEGRTPMASKPATAVAPARQTATAYLIMNDAARAIEFYKQAFGAVETMRLSGPGGRIGTRKSVSATPPSCSPMNSRTTARSVPKRSAARP